MSTRCIIAMKNPDQSVSGIYCHRNGSPDGVGYTLHCWYQDEEKGRSLMKLGELSSLGEELAPPEGKAHSFENPYPGVCVAYHRDRGETLRPAVTWKHQTDMLREAPKTHNAEFCYLWAGHWYIGLCRTQKWYLLSDVINAYSERGIL